MLHKLLTAKKGEQEKVIRRILFINVFPITNYSVTIKDLPVIKGNLMNPGSHIILSDAKKIKQNFVSKYYLFIRQKMLLF